MAVEKMDFTAKGNSKEVPLFLRSKLFLFGEVDDKIPLWSLHWHDHDNTQWPLVC
jgi:hypothetical protein